MDNYLIFGAIVGFLALVVGFYNYKIVFRQRRDEVSQAVFKDARRREKSSRSELSRSIAELGHKKRPSHLLFYDNLPLLTKQNWLPAVPVPLENVNLNWRTDPGVKIVLKPRNLPYNGGRRFRKYSDAIVELDPPDLFDDRPQYRLTDIEQNSLTFSEDQFSYFDKINYGGYLAHEAALRRNWKDLFGTTNRKLLLKRFKKPADYMVLSGISTLTLIHHDNSLRFIMHLRGAKKTAYAMGTYHVIPAGEFQPSSKAPASFREDFSLWKNIMREYGEEVLGMTEHDGSGAVPFDYKKEPFPSLEKERMGGNIKAYYLGTGLDPITYQGEILTVVVFKHAAFKKIFPCIKTKNTEGSIITDEGLWGRPFSEVEVESYQRKNIMATGDALLKLSWKHREFFNSCFD